MSSRPGAFVVVGANSTGGTAAATLRTEGFEGQVVLIGAEPHPPYERPPLSKEYLRGESQMVDALLRPAAWYADNGIETLYGVRAIGIDAARKVVRLEDREGVHYDSVLIATGGANRRLPVRGADLEGIHDLRTFEDADRIREAARTGGRAVVVGAGFIGCEVAASLRSFGVEVDVVEPLPAPLVRAVGLEVGALFEGIHREHGVTFHLGESVSGFEGSGGRVEAVTTDRGKRIECEFAVVGVGIGPATQVTQHSGVALDDGILVDEFCRTNVEGVFAAGDVANHWHPLFGRRHRVEHWDNALKHGAAAARSMLATGEPEPYADPHWFWSDQYGYNLQLVGSPTGWDELVVRGSLARRDFVAFYLKGGLVEAAVGLNRGREVRRAAALVRARRPFDPVALRDEDVDLRKLATAVAAAPSEN
jgi:3-phenylpropionate/trans-cinnamate dioxygenase ferredoxin reductase subunit